MKLLKIPSSFYIEKEQIRKFIALDPKKFIVYNDAYKDIFNRKERYQILYGGSGAGKSDAKATDLLIKAILNPYFKCLYCRKFSTEIRDSQFALLKDIIQRQGWQEWFKIRESDMEIICLLNGNRLTPHGLDDVHKLTSIHDITDVWLEEPLSKSKSAGHITEQDFTELDRRLRTTRATNHIHFTFNPIGTENWIYKCFFSKDAENGGKAEQYAPDTYALKTTYINNNFLDKVLELKKFSRQSAYDFRIYALGEWGLVKPENPFFYEFDIEKHVCDVQFNPSKPFFITFDLNIGIMACTVWQLNIEKQKMYCVLEFAPCLGIEERCNSILSSPIAQYLDYCTVTGDSTANARTAFLPNQTFYSVLKSSLNLRSTQIKVATSNWRHSDSRLLCNSILRNFDFAIDRKCVKTIADLQMTLADSQDGIDKKAHDPHYADGYRYLCQNFLSKYFIPR